MRNYQDTAMVFAQYYEWDYPFLALAEEVGEFVTYVAKHKRGDAKYEDLIPHTEAIKKEAGDVLWMLTACLEELGLSLDDVAEANIKKLSKRKVEGSIKGDGDNR